MSEEKSYTEAEAHRMFAIQFNGQTWDLLDKTDRTAEEDALMVHSAHASHRHWAEAGTGVHQQRGEWLISRTYAVLGLGEAALRHANRCLQLTEAHGDLMADFDWAYAYESVARANAIAGQKAEALEYIERAAQAGQAIADEQNREIFVSDFDGGNWAGLR
jgi:hypothetical protein